MSVKGSSMIQGMALLHDAHLLCRYPSRNAPER
jgi:hypothetical protein